MCSECLRVGKCAPGCPNEQPIVVHRCEICGGDICEGDAVYKLQGHIYCEDCVYHALDMAVAHDA